MVSLFGCRRRTQTKISVLLWFSGVNHLSPSSSRTFWGQYHWSGNAGSCVDCTWNISLYIPCRKQFQYIFNSQQRIDTWRSVFFLPVDPRDENHRDPENTDYSVPRRARYVQNTWKRHQDTVFWIDIDLGIIKEGLKFYQTRSNAIILQGVLPPSCIVRAERLKSGEPLYKRQYLSPRPPPKISLRHDLNWTRGNDDLGSTVEHRPVGKLVQQSLGETVHLVLPSQPNPLKPMKIVRGNP